MTQPATISGSGIYLPPNIISNAELVTAFNTYVEQYNQQHEAAIASGQMEALQTSSAEFIEKASGIKQRYVVDKAGLLDPSILAPRLQERSNNELSLQAEMAVGAAKIAMQNAGRTATDIDVVIFTTSLTQRSLPAMGIEVQNALGIKGYAYDMTAACSAAAFAIDHANSMVQLGKARAVLIVNPEIYTGQLNFKDRSNHFIFGDAATALLIENAELASSDHQFEIIDSRCYSQFSNNIRNDFGFLNSATPETLHNDNKLFQQNGHKVFKEVSPLVAKSLKKHLKDLHIPVSDIKRIWLHQANRHINEFIAKKLLGTADFEDVVPIVLDEFGNTGSCGAIIAFHRHNNLQLGELGIICAFGAGYTLGSIVIKKR